MKKIIFIFAFLAAGSLYACDLEFDELNLCAEVSWIKPAAIGQESTLRLDFEAEDQISSVKVVLWMPRHGHGSRPTKVRELLATDTSQSFLVSEMYFVMPGLWEVRVTAAQGEDSETKILSLEVLR